MATYRLVTDDGYESDIEAASIREAIRTASRVIQDEYKPYGSRTYWVYARIRDADEVRLADWVEAIDPEPPRCEPPTPELAAASLDDLQHAWGVGTMPDGCHVWASPKELTGPRRPRIG